MIEVTNKSQFIFDGLSAEFAIDSVGDAYITPAGMSETLGDFARLTYINAKAQVKLELSGSVTGEVEVKLLAGSSVIGSTTIDLSSGTEVYGSIDDINTNGVNGGTALRLQVVVNTAAAGGATAKLLGKLNVEHPIVLS